MVRNMISTSRERRRGFTMLEVMIALAILLVASVGALSGLMAASKDLKTGQLHLYQSILVEATVQRMRLADKKLLLDYAYGQATYPVSTGTTNPTAAVNWSMASDPEKQPVDAAPWGADPWTATTTDTLDLSTGKFFFILPSGEITPVAASAIPVTTACSDGSVPNGMFCREVAIIPSAPSVTPGPITAAGFRTATVWIRVSQKGTPLSRATVAQEVIAQ